MIKTTYQFTFLLLAVLMPKFTLGAEPNYCAAFSSSDCQKIKEIVNKKTVPSYCRLSAQDEKNVRELEPYQLRACGVVTSNSGSNAKNTEKEDAESLVKETWASRLKLVEQIVIGAKCEVLPRPQANAAIYKIQLIMQQDLVNAGIYQTTDMSIAKTTENTVNRAKEKSMQFNCSQLSPSYRAKLRMTTQQLALD